MRTALLIWVGGLCLAAAPAMTAPPDGEDPAHEELRALFRGVMGAYDKGDWDELVSYMDDDVVVTWQNAVVTKSPQKVKAYFLEMLHGPQRRVDQIQIKPQVDELTHLYGNMGVAFGSSEDSYKLRDGMEFTQNTRWTATVVRKNGRWKIASVHISTNMFDNPVLSIAVRKTALWVGGMAGVLGLALGGLLTWLALRRRHRGAPGVANAPA